MADPRTSLRLVGLLLVGGLAAGCAVQSTPGPEAPTSSAPAPPGAGASQPADPTGTGSPDGAEAAPGPDGSSAPADEGDGTNAGPGEPDPTGVLPTAEPVPLEAPADFGTDVTATVDSVRAIQAQAQGPGETSGPALVFTVTFTNSSTETVDLGSVTINLAGSDGAPGVQMIGPPASPVSGVIAAGESATGVYVFTLDRDQQDRVRLEVTYSTQAPVVAFEGSTGV